MLESLDKNWVTSDLSFQEAETEHKEDSQAMISQETSSQTQRPSRHREASRCPEMQIS